MSFLDSREASAASGIGKSVPRREDARLLTGRGQYAADFNSREDARLLSGRGQYAADFNLPGQAFAYVLRSPHAHAKIVDIDLASATGARCAGGVLVGSDALADGI